MSVKLLTEHHLEFLSLKGGCIGSSESIYVKMPHCWKSHVAARIDLAQFTFAHSFTASLKLSISRRSQVADMFTPIKSSRHKHTDGGFSSVLRQLCKLKSVIIPNYFTMMQINPRHAEYSYVLHFFPIFILFTCSIPVVSIYFHLEWETLWILI